MRRIKRHWYPVLLIFLTCVTYYKIFGYAFWRDDWGFFWGVSHNDRMLFTYLFHPSTIGEFILLNWLFGSSVFWWNAFGVLLKILASFSVYRCIRGLARSETVGMMAGLLFATTPIGLESVGWSGAHVVLLDTLFFCYATAYFMEYQEKKSKHDLFYCILFTCLSLISDPVRALPLIPIFFLYKLLFYPFASPKIVKRTIAVISFFCILFFGLFIALNFEMAIDTRIIQAAIRHGWDLFFYVRKTALAFSVFFSSLGNVWIGWIVRTKEDVGFSDPSLIGFTAGLIPFFVLFYLWNGIMNGVHAMKMQRKILFFLLLWTYLFYVPNWIFNIIMTPGYTNRYLVVSSVGYVGIIACLICFIRAKVWKKLLFTGIVVAQMIIVYSINNSRDVFRSNRLFQQLTDRMDQEVPKAPGQYLLVAMTDYPEFSKGFFISKQVPFVIKRNISNREEFPLFADSATAALPYLCGQVKINNAVLRNVPIKEPTQIADVYAWDIGKQGDIRSSHQEMRGLLEEKIRRGACTKTK